MVTATVFFSRMPLLLMVWLMPVHRAITTIRAKTTANAVVYSFSFFASFCSASCRSVILAASCSLRSFFLLDALM